MLRIICTRDDIRVDGTTYFEGEEVNSWPDDCWTAARRELARLHMHETMATAAEA